MDKPLEKLREAQLKEVADASEAKRNAGAPLVPTVQLRRDRQRASAAGENGAGGAAAVAAFDPSELAEEVDLLKALRKTDYSTLKNSKVSERCSIEWLRCCCCCCFGGVAKLIHTALKCALGVWQKWNERRDALELIVSIGGPTPKFTPNDGVEDIFDDLRNVLTREKVVNIRISACKACEALSKGLQKSFSSKASRVVPVILAQFKEKSKPLEEQIMHTVIVFMKTSTSLSAHISHLEKVLSEKKFPQIREKALELARRIVEDDSVSAGGGMPDDGVALFSSAFCAATDETVPTMRALGVSGMKALLAKFGGEDSPHHKRILKALSAVEEKHPRVYKAIVGKPANKSPSGGGSKAPGATKPKTGRSSKTSSPVSKARPVRNRTSNGGGGAESTAHSATSRQVAPVELLSPEEAADAMGKLDIADWAEHAESFSATAWQAKVAAYQAITEHIEKASGLSREVVHAVFSFVADKSRGFRDSNFNLAIATLSVVRALARSGDNFSGGHAAFVINAIAAKFGDRKVHEAVVETMECFCDSVEAGVHVVMSTIPGALAKTRSPVTLGACFEYMATVISNHGAIHVDCKSLVNFLNGSGPAAGLKSTNRNVAPRARGILAAVFHQLGPKFQTFVKSQVSDAAIIKLLEEDFEKIGFDPAKAQTFKKAVVAGNAPAVNNDLEIPRADLVSLLPDNINKQLSNTSTKTAWQIRSKALEEVGKAIETANNSIILNKGSADLLRILNDRCLEANVNVKRVALATTKAFLASVASAKRAKIGRLIVEGLMQSFADKKDAIRESAVEAMAAFVEDDENAGEVHVACFLSCFKALTAILEMAAFRGTALAWLQTCLDSSAIKALNVQLVPLVPSLIGCMCDRTSSVRSAAEQCLGQVYSCAPKKTESAIKRVVQDLKPAEQRAVQAAISKIKSSASSQGSESKKTGAAHPASVQEASSKRSGHNNKRLAAPAAKPAASGRKVIRGAGATPTTDEDVRILVECPLRDRNRREKKYLKSKWIWDVAGAPREDFIAALRVDFEHYFTVGSGPETVRLLFSSRDTDHCSGIQKLSICVRDFPRELISVTDLVLKWATYRMCLRDNTKAIQALQTFLQQFLQMLINHSYEMADFEAHSLLPFLCEKVGHRSDRFRTSYRAIMAQLRQLYPAAKMAPFFVEALHSKNAKTHSECMEELGILVRETENWKICGRKGTRLITEHCGSSDAATRNAAIAIIYQVWKQYNFDWDDLKKVVGDLSPKILSLMQEKFRTLKSQDKGRKDAAGKIIATPNTIRGGGAGRKVSAPSTDKVSGTEADDFGDVFTLDVVTLSPARGAAGTNNESEEVFSASSIATPAPASLSSKSMAFTSEKSRVLQPSSMLGVALDHISQLTPEYGSVQAGTRIEGSAPAAHSRAVTAIKAVIDLAQIATGEPGQNADTLDFEKSSVVEVFQAEQAQIMDTLLSCIQGAATSPGILDFRILSLILSVLMKIMGIKEFATQTRTSQVQKWMDLMVQLLTSPKIDARNKTDDALCRAVNYLTAKVVDEAPLGASICAAFALLSNEDTTATTTRHSILLKHLEKIFKREEAKASGAYDCVDVDTLLMDMTKVVPEHYTNSIAQDVARTICRNLLSSRSDTVATAVNSLNSGSPVVQTIRELQSEIQSSIKTIGNEEYDYQIASIVASMLKSDASPADQKDGIQKLRQLQLDYPTQSITASLEKTPATKPFQNFIHTELAALAEAEADKEPSAHQGSVSLQSRLARMQQKYQIRTSVSDSGVVSGPDIDSAATKENGAVVNGNLDMRQQKAAKMMNETRDSLNKMRERLQKLKVGATPAKTKAGSTEPSASPDANASNGDSSSSSAGKTSFSNLRDRLKMWQAKHSS